MKTLALDLGDSWTGTALSDPLGISARPYKTIKAGELETFLTELFLAEPIATVVVGCPLTMSGTHSEQTKKIIAHKEELEKKFPSLQWILWDERLSSKRASSMHHKKSSKEDKHAEHSIAAAFILQTYLDSKAPPLL